MENEKLEWAIKETIDDYMEGYLPSVIHRTNDEKETGIKLSHFSVNIPWEIKKNFYPDVQGNEWFRYYPEYSGLTFYSLYKDFRKQDNRENALLRAKNFIKADIERYFKHITGENYCIGIEITLTIPIINGIEKSFYTSLWGIEEDFSKEIREYKEDIKNQLKKELKKEALRWFETFTVLEFDNKITDIIKNLKGE